MKAAVRLSALVAVVAVSCSAAGLFWDRTGGERFAFTTVRGDEVQITGTGLYRYDTVFKEGIFRGTDAATLLFAVPLLLFALSLYRRGSLRGALLLTSTLAFFLYNSASMAFGVAFNPLFPLYIVYFSASLFAFILAFASVDRERLGATLAARLPHKLTATFLFVAGSVLLVWLLELVGPILEGKAPPNVASYTTEVTHVLDLGVIAPLAVTTGVLLLRRRPIAYVLTSILLVVNALIGVVVISQTVGQKLSGVTITPAQFIAFVASFSVMSLFALALAIRMYRGLREA